MSFAIRFFLCCRDSSKDNSDPTVKKSDLVDGKQPETKRENEPVTVYLSNQGDQPYGGLSFSDLTAIKVANPEKSQLEVISEKDNGLTPTGSKVSQDRDQSTGLISSEHKDGKNVSDSSPFNHEMTTNGNSPMNAAKLGNEEEGRGNRKKGTIVFNRITRKEKEPGLQADSPKDRRILNSTPIMRASTLKQ